MRKKILRLFQKDIYTEEKFNKLLKKLNINMVTLSMKENNDVKDDKKKPTLDLNNDVIYNSNNCSNK